MSKKKTYGIPTGKVGGKPTRVPISKEQFEEIKCDMKEKWERQSKADMNVFVHNFMYHLLSMMCVVLHDNFGFGGVRLKRVIEGVFEQLDCVQEGYVTVDDIAEMIAAWGLSFEFEESKDVTKLPNYQLEVI